MVSFTEKYESEHLPFYGNSVKWRQTCARKFFHCTFLRHSSDETHIDSTSLAIFKNQQRRGCRGNENDKKLSRAANIVQRCTGFMFPTPVAHYYIMRRGHTIAKITHQLMCAKLRCFALSFIYAITYRLSASTFLDINTVRTQCAYGLRHHTLTIYSNVSPWKFILCLCVVRCVGNWDIFNLQAIFCRNLRETFQYAWRSSCGIQCILYTGRIFILDSTV